MRHFNDDDDWTGPDNGNGTVLAIIGGCVFSAVCLVAIAIRAILMLGGAR